MEKSGWMIGLFIAAGIALAGVFIGDGIASFTANDRRVSVKGLAEKLVEADRAVWPISYVAASNNLAEARQQLNDARKNVLSFLNRYEIPAEDIELQDLRIQDKLARNYTSNNVGLRYLLQQTVLVRTSKVDAAASAAQHIGDLLDAGILLGNIEGYGASTSPHYVFTQLNEIKPAMIAEATANARLAAQEFAKDAKTSIDGILSASQGRFEILPAENAAGLQEHSQIHKKVRVVTTLEYVLGN